MTPKDEPVFELGDRVQFIEPGFRLTGIYGVVEGTTPLTLLVQFDNGVASTWPKRFFVKAFVSPSIPPYAKKTPPQNRFSEEEMKSGTRDIPPPLVC